MENKTRPIKELLQVMLDNTVLFKVGLCRFTELLLDYRLITFEENIILRDYIYDNRPSKFSSIDAFINRDEGYFWPCGKIEPRIKWIRTHIKKLENEQSS